MDMVSSPRRLHQAREEEKYLSRIKKVMPDKFRDMCNMHLAFILNLSDDKLEAILHGHNNAGKRKLTLAPIFRKKVKTGCLFGAPLANESVCLMTPLIKFLSEKENLSKEGLFRKPGNRQRMRNLREALIAKGPSVEIDPAVYNAYDISGVLKEFLRDMPEPLLSDRHMEAHRQINALGNHARTSEDLARYATKKLSALQLLMQLLPHPFALMTKQVLTLLHAVSSTAETKMTPSTLATIFAPIFFLDRKVSALDVCDAVKEAEPALTFMIENTHKMFKVPKELSVDVINYWKSLESNASTETKPCDSNGKLNQSYKIRKSISGRTLNTAVCYLDREQCKTVDVASHTQAELDNLFAHVQSLPDTPSNQRIKDLMARRSRTPLSSGGKHTRSKSIGASIRKMVPSLTKSKTKSLDLSVQSQASPYRNTKVNNTSVMSDVMRSPANVTLSSTTSTIAQSISLHTCHSKRPMSTFNTSATTSTSQHHQTPLTRKRINTENQPPISHCTPPKQECRNSKMFAKAGSLNHSDINSSNCSLNHSSYSSSSKSPKIDTVLQEKKCDSSSSDTVVVCNSNSNSTNNNSTKPKLKRSFRSTSLPSLSVATPQEIKDVLTSSQQITAVESENEISYMPSFTQLNDKNSFKTASSNERESPVGSPLSRRPLRPCNVPGTPIMPRAVLSIPRYTFETSL